MSSASCGSRGASRSVSWVSSSSTVAVELVDLGREGLVVGRQFAGGLEVTARRLQLAVGRHDRRQLREPPTDLAGLARVRVQVGIGELTLEVGVLGQDGVDGRRGVGHIALLPLTHSASLLR